jgi:hypothetical protein
LRMAIEYGEKRVAVCETDFIKPAASHRHRVVMQANECRSRGRSLEGRFEFA